MRRSLGPEVDPTSEEAGVDRPKISVHGVRMTYATDEGTLTVLDDVELAVREGELVCMLGPSGCGKSTLLNVIGGFLQPTAGRVLFDGEPAQGPDPRRIFVFQERGVFPWLTVEGNIAFGLAALPEKERQRRVEHYVRVAGLSGFEKAYPQALSGGMKQRVEVARALAVDPEVLYLDEPFGALDSITRHTMRAELLRLWSAEKKTILFVTHDIDESLQLADRVVVMSARPGRIQRIVDVELPRPRNQHDPRYVAFHAELAAELGLAHG